MTAYEMRISDWSSDVCSSDLTDSNYGFNLPWWDRLFGTYRPQPRDGHPGMTIGLADFRSPGDQRLDRMLLQPLRPSPAADGRAGDRDRKSTRLNSSH